MKERLKVSGYLMQGNGIPPKTLALTFGISFLCHAMLIGAMFFLPEYRKPVRNPFSSAINVSLVSFSAGPPAGEARVAGATAAQAGRVGQKEEIPVLKVQKTEKTSKPDVKMEKKIKAVSLSPEKIPAKKKVEASSLISDAIKNLEKKVDGSRSATVNRAIDQLRSQVESSGDIKTAGVPGGGIKTNAQTGVPGGFGSGTGTGVAAGLFDVYKAEIYYRIQQNWAYSEQLGGGNSDQMAVLVIKIMPGGEISDIRFERKSGNRFLDESAYRAVQKSNPLPPIPQEFNRPYYEVGLRFGAGGLTQK